MSDNTRIGFIFGRRPEVITIYGTPRPRAPALERTVRRLLPPDLKREAGASRFETEAIDASSRRKSPPLKSRLLDLSFAELLLQQGCREVSINLLQEWIRFDLLHDGKQLRAFDIVEFHFQAPSLSVGQNTDIRLAA